MNQKIIFVVIFNLMFNYGFSQILSKDTTWIWGIDNDTYYYLDTCVESQVPILKSSFDNIGENYGFIYFEKFGLKHYVGNTNVYQDTFLVSDGTTSCFYKNGNLGRILKYDKGVKFEEIFYDETGKLESKLIIDTIQKRWVRHNYNNGIIFNSEKFIEEDSIIHREWYPNNNLRLTKGEIKETLDLTKNDFVEIEFNLGVRFVATDVELFFDEGIIVKIDAIQVTSGDTIEVNTGKDLQINLKIIHDKETIFNKKEFILRRNFDEIRIPIKIKGYHIDYAKIEQDYKFTIEQSTTNKIFIDQIGTETSIGLTGNNIEDGINVGFQACQINLENLPKGEYNINIGSCHTSGNIQFEIK